MKIACRAREPIYRTSGNVLLGQLLGAEHILYPEGEDEAGADQALRDHADALRAQGRVPYVIPLGLKNKPLGALGYMDAAREALVQKGDFEVVVIPSGSGATHMGFLAGLRATWIAGAGAWHLCAPRCRGTNSTFAGGGGSAGSLVGG